MKAFRKAPFVLLLIGCNALTGEEVGRLPINIISTDDNLVKKETTVELKQGDEIVFYSEMDFEYEGEAVLQFKINILKDGEQFGQLNLDPTEKNFTMGEVKTEIMGKTKWSFTGQNAVLQITDGGSYKFEGILVASDNETLKINKAEFVIKKT